MRELFIVRQHTQCDRVKCANSCLEWGVSGTYLGFVSGEKQRLRYSNEGVPAGARQLYYYEEVPFDPAYTVDQGPFNHSIDAVEITDPTRGNIYMASVVPEREVSRALFEEPQESEDSPLSLLHVYFAQFFSHDILDTEAVFPLTGTYGLPDLNDPENPVVKAAPVLAQDDPFVTSSTANFTYPRFSDLGLSEPDHIDFDNGEFIQLSAHDAQCSCMHGPPVLTSRREATSWSPLLRDTSLRPFHSVWQQ